MTERTLHTAGEGNGPVNALDTALRKALVEFYPEVQEIRLTDYKVRVIDEGSGTEATVRVMIDSSDGEFLLDDGRLVAEHHRGVVARPGRFARVRPAAGARPAQVGAAPRTRAQRTPGPTAVAGSRGRKRKPPEGFPPGVKENALAATYCPATSRSQYRRRWGASRPCAGWERVGPPRSGHQSHRVCAASRERRVCGAREREKT